VDLGATPTIGAVFDSNDQELGAKRRSGAKHGKLIAANPVVGNSGIKRAPIESLLVIRASKPASHQPIRRRQWRE